MSCSLVSRRRSAKALNASQGSAEIADFLVLLGKLT
jgi:hypothetical protein